MNAQGSVADDVAPATAGSAAGQGQDPPPTGARAQQVDLERVLAEPDADGAASQDKAKPGAEAADRGLIRRFVKIGLGLALMIGLGWGPLRALLAATSVEAVVNARVETIRSPIEGIVEWVPDSARSWSASEPAPRLRIVDPLADHALLDDLRRRRQALDSEARMLERQSELAAAALKTLEAQIDKFRDGRLRLLEARLSAQTAQYEAAAAKASQAAAAKRRTEALSRSGIATAAETDRTRYEWAAASSAETAERRRADETKVERDAIADGTFVGDSYNDSPSSEQRAAELRLKAGELDARAAALRSQANLLAEQIAEEEARFRARSEASVALPPSGRVWEALTAPGERVAKGQDLMRVLDCSRPLVSANVGERVYNRLEVGGRVTFRPAGRSGEELEGLIVNLTGAAAAPGNFAIPPGALRKAPFYVTVALNGVTEGACAVGRTGTVAFASGDEAAAASSRGPDAALFASLRAGFF